MELDCRCANDNIICWQSRSTVVSILPYQYRYFVDQRHYSRFERGTTGDKGTVRLKKNANEAVEINTVFCYIM